MAAKRAANKQLTDRNWNDAEETEEAGIFSRADSSTINQRVVKKARRRGNVGGPGGTAGSGGTGVFAGFTGLVATKTTPAPMMSSSSWPSNANGAKSLFTTAPTQHSPTHPKTTMASVPASSPLGGGFQPTVGSPTNRQPPNRYASYREGMKALNSAFLASVQKHLAEHPHYDLSPMFKDYERYEQDFEKMEAGNSRSQNISTPSPPTVRSSRSDPSGGTSPGMEQKKVRSSSISSQGFAYSPSQSPHKKPADSDSNSWKKPGSISSFPGQSWPSSQPSPVGAKKEATAGSLPGFASANTNANNENQDSTTADHGKFTGFFSADSDSAKKDPPSSAEIKFGGFSAAKADSQGQESTTENKFTDIFSFGAGKEKKDATPTPEIKFGAFPSSTDLDKKPAAVSEIKFGSFSSTDSEKKDVAPAPESKFAGFFSSGEKKDSTTGSQPWSLGDTTSAQKPFTFGGSQPGGAISFLSASKDSKALTLGADNNGKGSDGGGENPAEEDQPPPTTFSEVKEQDAIHSVRCKLFYKKDDKFQERGVGTLYLKTGASCLQLILRAETNLGNIVLNVGLPPSAPLSRQGKNNLMLVLPLNPPAGHTCPECGQKYPNPQESNACPQGCNPQPVPLLLRVKTTQDADALYQKIEQNRK